MTLPIVYIAGAYRAENAWLVEQNIRKAEQYAFDVATMGAMPLCPHTNTRFFNGTLTGRFWIEGTLELMRRCDAVMLIPGWEQSVGSVGERAEALRLGIPVLYSLGELQKWLDQWRYGEEVVHDTERPVPYSLVSDPAGLEYYVEGDYPGGD